MILMTGWRFGVQYLSDERYGCVADTFRRISRNVTQTEWNLPYTYNISCGCGLLFIAGGLPAYLCYKAYTMAGKNQRIWTSVSACPNVYCKSKGPFIRCFHAGYLHVCKFFEIQY